MAIYSFNHDTFGKTTNRAGAAGDNAAYNSREEATRLEGPDPDRMSAAANAAYNAREEAVYAIRSHIIPAEAAAAEAWFRAQEANERKNARMSDRFIAALPRELTPEQCLEAVEGFCRAVTGDRIPWHFALHLELEKRDEPDWNPHTHIIFRDRDIETGRRVLYTSAGPKERRALDAKGIAYWTTKDFRVAWNDHVNQALERSGHEVRVDHRSLEEQGIDRKPGIHVGPASQHALDKGHALESRDLEIGRRTIPYTILDEGTRAEHAARIKAGNEGPQMQATSPRAHALAQDHARLAAGQSEARTEMRAEQALDRDALRAAHSAEVRLHRAWAKTYGAEQRKRAEQTAEQVRAVTGAAWTQMLALQARDRTEMTTAHRLETAALSRAHAAEQIAVTARSQAESVQSRTNAIAAETRAGLVQQQAQANQQMKLRAMAEASPLERARTFTETANREHRLAEETRARLAEQRQCNRLLATAPEARIERAGAALRAVMDAAEPRRQADTAQARSQPFTVIDPATRARHEAAAKAWQTQQAAVRARPVERSLQARAQVDERKALAADQAQDRAALSAAHKAERRQQAVAVKALVVSARQTAVKEVRAALQPQWQAVRAIAEPAQRAEAVKALRAEHTAMRSQSITAAMAKVRLAAQPAQTMMATVQAQDRRKLSEAHALERAALARAQAIERQATRAPTAHLKAEASQQRRMVQDLRGQLTAHRQTCRLVAAGGVPSRDQAERAMAALRQVVREDAQKQGRSDAVARGRGTDADRANASPEARAAAARDAKADRVRRVEGATPNKEARAGPARKGGGRGR